MTRWLLLPIAALLIGLYLVAGNPPHANILLGGGGATPFNPATVTGLSYWFDPSDSTTVFTDAACTTPATANAVVLCIKDKSASACSATNSSDGPTLRNSGAVWWLEFPGANALQVTGSGCDTKISNKSFGLVAVGVSTPFDTNADAFGFTFTANAGTGWLRCSNNIDGTTEGWGLRARTVLADAGHNLSNATATTSAVAVRCHLNWSAAAAEVFQNNVSQDSCTSCTGLSASNTSNVSGTACIAAFFDGANCAGAILNGNIYQIIGVFTTSADIPTATRTAIDTWNCTKAGVTC